MTATSSTLHELIPEFYVKLGLDFRAKFIPGQICIAPVCYTYENQAIWRPFELDASGTSATVFKQASQPGDAYFSSNILHTPQLGAHEEFPVIRAKQRPVIVLIPLRDKVEVKETHSMMKLNKKLVTIAPCYGLIDGTGALKCDSKFLEGVNKLEYPHFMFLPPGGRISKPSLLRLDSIHHAFHSQLEPTQWAVAPDIWDIILGQLERIFSIGNGDDYVAARDILFGK